MAGGMTDLFGGGPSFPQAQPSAGGGMDMLFGGGQP